MKNNKKRGFTLTELLVVIAILAILATVSVVGYTSFIQNAHRSNDEAIVTQLNKFLTALQADHTSDYYGDAITEDNIWEITQEILKESGLNTLEAQSAQHGYHIYFQFNGKSGGQYVLRKEAGLTHSLAKRLWNFLTVGAVDVELSMPGIFSETVDGVTTYYFLAETGGSDIADAVRGFYTLEGEVFNGNFASFITLIGGDSFKLKYGSQLYDLAKKSVFVTKTGNYVVDIDDPHTRMFILEGAEYIFNSKQEVGGTPVYTSDAKPLITVDKNTVIRLPKGIKLPANSLNIAAADGKTVTIVFAEGSWDEVKQNVDAAFTNNNVLIKLNNDSYKLQDTVENEVVTAKSNLVYTLDGTYVTTLSSDLFPVTQFTIQCTGATANAGEGSAYIKRDATNSNNDILYLAYHPTVAYQLYADGFNADASDRNVTWSGANVSASGLFTIPNLGNTFDADVAHSFEITATAGTCTKKITVVLERITEVEINGFNVILDSDNTDNNAYTIEYNKDDALFFIPSVNGTPTYNSGDGRVVKYDSAVDGIVTVTLEEPTTGETKVFEKDDTNANQINFISNGIGGVVSGTQRVTISVGNHIKETFTITIKDKTTDFILTDVLKT